MSKLIWWLLVFMWMAGIWYLSDQPHLSSGLEQDWWLRKGAHIVEYAVLAALIWHALPRQMSWTQRSLLAFVCAVSYAGLDEWHQSWVPGRVGSWRDILFDSSGAAIATVYTWYRGRS